MKELFLLLLLLVYKSIFAQVNEQDLIDNFYKYTKKNVQWKSKSNIKSSSNDSTMIKLLLSESINNMHYCFEENGFSYYKNDFYFIDLDQDKIDEIIYNGRICGGYETESVVVFKSNNIEYKQILKVSGKITGITFNNELIINDYPCCSDIWQSIFCYKFTNDNLESICSVSFFIDDDLYKKVQIKNN